jgi:O-antigen ligase
MIPPAIGTEYLLFGGAGLISVLAFAALILVPALGSYGRTWEKATAAILSLFVLVALVGLGVGLGILIVYFWDDIYNFFT